MQPGPAPWSPPPVDVCSRCGSHLPLGVRYCPYCGNPIVAAFHAMPQTHSAGFVVIAVLISLLWFKVNNAPVFPLGLIGGILVAYWSHDIDTRLGKPSLLGPAIVLCVVATAIGFILR